MFFAMRFRGFGLLIHRLMAMAMGEVGMVRGFLVRARVMMLGRFFMMTSGMLMMFG
jgi:hypothetical protein